MKANELMVGDWVRIVDDDTDQSFETRITGVSGIGNIYAPLPDGEHAYPFGVDCIEPISITPEILEKNFGSARNGGYFEGDEFYELFIREINDGTWIIKHDNIEFSLPRQQVMVSYVHELQHALRLCGIDKEIVL